MPREQSHSLQSFIAFVAWSVMMCHSIRFLPIFLQCKGPFWFFENGVSRKGQNFRWHLKSQPSLEKILILDMHLSVKWLFKMHIWGPLGSEIPGRGTTKTVHKLRHIFSSGTGVLKWYLLYLVFSSLFVVFNGLSFQGCLVPIKVRIERGSILDPSEDAAVVGGNVLTSQRIVDVVFKAFQVCAASQVLTFLFAFR